MSTQDHDSLRSALRAALARHAGGAPDASVVAEATLGTWQDMAARLEPVIGARGVDALFDRSLQLASRSFPWLAIAGDRGNRAALLAGLRARIAARETADAVEAGNALLLTFTELLQTLIGEPLTGRLLGPVSSPPPPASEPETAP